MTTPELNPLPEWKQFLALGEAILAQPNAASQVALIQQTAEKLLNATIRLWLLPPFYPLPGQPPVSLLDPQTAPEIAQQAAQQQRFICYATADGQITPCTQDCEPHLAAIPLLTQNFVLGVLLAERTNSTPFRKEELNFLEGLASHAAMAMQISRQVTLKNWRSEQLALVRLVSAQIANIFDLNQLCQQVTNSIQEAFGYYSVSIYTLDPATNTLHLRGSASHDNQHNHHPTSIIRIGNGIIGNAAQTGQDCIAQDVTLEPLYQHVEVLPATRSEAALPLKLSDQIVGVLDIQMDHPNAFHEIDIIALHTLADSIALAIENAHLYTDLRWKAEQMEVVAEIGRALASILDTDELLQQIVQVIQNRFHYPYVHLFTVHSGRRKVIYAAGSGERSSVFCEQGLAYDLDDPVGLIPAAARTGRTFLVNDVSQEPLYRPTELPPDDTQSELVIPIQYGEEVLGILDIQSAQRNAFSQSDRTLFEALSASIATAMRNAALYRSEQWRHKVADSFQDVAALLTTDTNLDTLLHTVLIKLQENLPCDASAIWLFDDLDEQQLRLASWNGVDAGDLLQAIENNPDVRTWLLSATQLNEPTIRTPASPYGPLGVALNFPADYSSIAVPLRSGDNLMGVLTLAHHTPGRYGSEAKALTSTFANYTAIAIQNARLYTAAQEQAWIATIMLQVAEAAQSIGSIEELLDTMVRLTPLLVGVSKCAFFLWKEALSAFVLTAAYGMENSRTHFDKDLPAFQRLSNTQSILFIQDAATELDLPEVSVSPETGTLVLFPLTARGQILGAFLVAHESKTPEGIISNFEQQTLAILQGITHQTAIAVENIHLLETRQEEAYVTAVLLQVAQAVVSQNNLHDILDTIVHLMPILIGINACAIYLWNNEENLFRLAQIFTGSHQEEETLRNITYRPGTFALLDAVKDNDTLVLCLNASNTAAPHQWPNLTCLSAGETPPIRQANDKTWVIGFPLSVKGEIYGVLVTQETGVPTALQERRLELINGVAQQVALAIQNERLKQEMVRSERLEREIQLARQIQQTFLPSHLPNLPHWELDVRWETARQVGGDFYDIFKLGKGRLGLVIADVSDKGLPAALYMTVTRTLIRAYMHGTESPARVLERVNALLLSESQNGMFVTAVYAILSLETGQLLYANAGHNRPLILHSETGQVEALPKGGIALGVMDNVHYQDHSLAIAPCDTLLFYTDGLTEAFSINGEIFGEERILATLAAASCSSVKELLEDTDRAISEFRQGAAPSDDLTLLALRRLPEN
jgi:GAF domain-containing protein